MERLISDLPLTDEAEKVVLVKPQLSSELFQPHHFLSREKMISRPPDDDVYQKIFDSIINLFLVHTGSLACYSCFSDSFADKIVAPLSFKPCGGEIQIVNKIPDSESLNISWIKKSDQKLFITCSNPACKMSLISGIELSELQNIFLHLMIKQMFPQLNFCNYVACDKRPDDLVSAYNYSKELQDLGLVAIASDRIFLGTINNGFFPSWQEWYSLGFILMPDMKTLYGFDGFDEWARFLISKKMKQWANLLQSAKPQIFGPKPAKKTK